MPILLPQGVADAMVRDHGRGVAETLRVLEFKRALQQVDSRFTDVFLAREDADKYGVRKGFWYLERRDDHGRVSLIESSNADGSYREPDQRTLDALRGSDLWDRRVWDDISRARDTRERNRKAAKRRAREDAAEHLKERADFEFRVQVPVTPDGRGRLRNR